MEELATHAPDRSDRQRWRNSSLVFVIALAARLIWSAHVHNPPKSDFAWYHFHAIAILNGLGYTYHGQPTAYFPVGYPLFLAGLYGLFGAHWETGIAANAVLNAATAGLVCLCADRLIGRAAGLASGLVMALYLPQIVWSGVLDSEVLFTFLFMLVNAIWLLRSPRSYRFWPIAASGAAIGLACLVRPVLMLLPVVLFAYCLISHTGWRKALLHTATAAIAMAIVIAPMTLRNAVELHAFVPVSTNGGVNLWQANNPQATGTYFWPANPAQNPFFNYVANEIQDNRIATHDATQFIEQHPGKFIQLGLRKWHYFFTDTANTQFWGVDHAQPPLSPASAKRIDLLSVLEYRLVLVLAACGILFQAARMLRTGERRVISLWLCMAYYIALFFVFSAWSRMRMPLEPWLCLFAGLGIIVVARPARLFTLLNRR